MYFGLVHFPNIDTRPLDQLRRKYDPTVDLIEPHITVIFPVPDTVGEVALVEHIEYVLRPWKPFTVRAQGFHKSWDHWLFMGLEKGCSEVIKLNKELYTGILSVHRRDDIGFIPHIGLGLFVEQSADYNFADPRQLAFDADKYNIALQEAKALDLNFNFLLDRLQLVKISADFSRIERGRVFLLSA